MTSDHHALLRQAQQALDAGTQTQEEVVPRLMAALKANPSATGIIDYLNTLYQDASRSPTPDPAWIHLINNDLVIMRLLKRGSHKTTLGTDL